MDLSLVWENDYDIQILKEKILGCRNCRYEPKEKNNTLYTNQIYGAYDHFIGIIDLLVRRKMEEGPPHSQIQK